ncbi:hypothetical protein LT493_08660 [Streptomyces tricolor]|nr:hypothetical protein [Streptomyces tricolor]
MITDRSYAVEPWTVRETTLDLDVLAQSESVFALSNGHVGWRGNLDEGRTARAARQLPQRRPRGAPAAVRGGRLRLPGSGQTVINVTNGKILRLLVDDEPFDLRYGRLVAHERVLDLRRGVLERTCEWTSPAGSTVRVRSTRLVSLTQRAVAAVAYEVEPSAAAAGWSSSRNWSPTRACPTPTATRARAKALKSPLEQEDGFASEGRLRLVHRTRRRQASGSPWPPTTSSPAPNAPPPAARAASTSPG